MSATTDDSKVSVFGSVQCYGLDEGDSSAVVRIAVADGQVVIDDRVFITAEEILMVCRNRHADKRVKITYRDHGTEHVLFLNDTGLSGRIGGNRRLYTAMHDALLQRSDDVLAGL